MSLPPSLFRCAALLLACGAAPALGADTADSSVMYRCPGNDYKNTISAKEAEKLGCKRIEGAPVTVIQMTKPRASTAVPAASGRQRRRPRRPGGPARPRQRRAPHPRGRAEVRRRKARGDAEGIQQRPAGAAGRREELPEVPRPSRARCAPRSRASRSTSPRSSARSRSCRRRSPSDRSRIAAGADQPGGRAGRPRPAGDDGRRGHARGRVRVRQFLVRDRARAVAAQHDARRGVRLVRRCRRCCATPSRRSATTPSRPAGSRPS